MSTIINEVPSLDSEVTIHSLHATLQAHIDAGQAVLVGNAIGKVQFKVPNGTAPIPGTDE